MEYGRKVMAVYPKACNKLQNIDPISMLWFGINILFILEILEIPFIQSIYVREMKVSGSVSGKPGKYCIKLLG